MSGNDATPLTDELIEALRALDTPTICNALEIVAPERRALGFTTEPLVCARPKLAPIVGIARTATIRAKQPSELDGDALKDLRLGYYEHVAAGPMPAITVIQDLDQPNAGYTKAIDRRQYRKISVPLPVTFTCRFTALTFTKSSKPRPILASGTAASGPGRLSFLPFRLSVRRA